MNIPGWFSLVKHRGCAQAHRRCGATRIPALACFPRLQLHWTLQALFSMGNIPASGLPVQTPKLLICCLYPKVWMRRRRDALRVSKDTLTPQSKGSQGTLPRGWYWVGPGLRLPAPQGWLPVTEPALGRSLEALDAAFASHSVEVIATVVSVRVRFSLKAEKHLNGTSLISVSLAFCPLYSLSIQ